MTTPLIDLDDLAEGALNSEDGYCVITAETLTALLDEVRELRAVHRTRTEDAVERLHRLADLYDPDEVERLTVELDFASRERAAARAEVERLHAVLEQHELTHQVVTHCEHGNRVVSGCPSCMRTTLSIWCVSGGGEERCTGCNVARDHVRLVEHAKDCRWSEMR